MKNIFLTLIAIFAITQISYAQWTSGSSGSYYLTSGNVGIGTTAPASLLHISASSAIEMLSLHHNNGSNGGNWAINPYIYGISNGGLSFVDKQHSTVPFVISDGGNVGIGVTAPASLLSLNSTNNTDLLLNRSTAKYARVVFATAGANKWYIGMDNDVTPGAETFVIEDPASVKFAIVPSGNVGIGTKTPTANLEVKGPTEQLRLTYDAVKFTSLSVNSIGNTSITSVGNINLTADNNLLFNAAVNPNFIVDAPSGSGSFVTLRSGTAGSVSNYTIGSGVGSVNSLRFINNASGSTVMTLNINNVGIGTTDTKGYKLAVKGNAIAESMTVKLYGSWPDYVFKPTYKLPSLTEVKAYIDKNQHLPGMPSEADVIKEGINLGEIVKLQTKKIEELTLYLIAQQKQIDELKQRVSKN